MKTTLLYGKPVVENIKNTVKSYVSQHNITSKLLVLGFNEPRFQQYANSIVRSAPEYGIVANNVILSDDTTLEQLVEVIKRANVDENIGGIIVQQPLPKALCNTVEYISPNKDIDCLTSANIAKMYATQQGIRPATPSAVMELLKFYNVDLLGKNVCIIGRGISVGRPLSLLMLEANATPTLCHTKTVNLPKIAKTADIVVSACGSAGLIDENYVNSNTVLVDVGLSFVDGKTCGDVNIEKVTGKCKYVTPVPGGIGPVTRACLFMNFVKAIQLR